MKAKIQFFKHGLIKAFVVILLFQYMQLGAQQPNNSLPVYTDSQRWGRLSGLNVSAIVSEIELGKAKGMSIDEIGIWLGNYYAATWAGGLDARSLATSFRWNALSDPNAKVEMTTFTDTLVVMRSFLTAVNSFGPDKKYRGVTLDEYKRVWEHVNRIIAEYVDVKLESRYEGDWMVLTFRNSYQAIRASDEVRWNRAAFLVRIYTIDVIRTGKAAGKTPKDIGLETAKVWASAWTGTDSPWRLLRGMAWNNFTDPDFVCEIISANTKQVKAKCNRPWIGTVRANEKRTGVSIDDYEAYQLGIEQGIATFLGMTWDVVLDGNSRVITVQKK